MSNIRISPREDGTLDEVVVVAPACVHLEQMGDDCWWLGIDLPDGGRVAVWLGTRGRKARQYVLRSAPRVQQRAPAQKPQRIYGAVEREPPTK